MSELVKATFLLPVRDNDGRDLSGEIQVVEAECYDALGPFTLMGFFQGRFPKSTGEEKADTSGLCHRDAGIQDLGT